MNILDSRLEIRKALRVLVWSLTTIASATPVAYADSPKATEAVSLNFSKIEHTYTTNGAQGTDVAVSGTLHIVSQTLLSSGALVGFILHTNLSDAAAVSVDGATSYVAVGASDGIPAECQPTACAPSFWTLTFRLVPLDRSRQSSLLFDETLKTQYAADGSLASVCVVGEDGCDTGVIP